MRFLASSQASPVPKRVSWFWRGERRRSGTVGMASDHMPAFFWRRGLFKPLSHRERGWGEGQRSRSTPAISDVSASAAHSKRTLMMNVLSASFVGGALGQAWRRSPRGRPFLCSCKERNQRNTPQAARPALRSGFASGPGIFVRHIHVPYENAVIHDGALRVLPDPLAVPHGGPKATATAKHFLWICPAQLRGPLGPAVTAGQTP